MIRNAVLHIANEQPLIADLFEMPGPTDLGLRLTNLRALDGKKPIFIDDMKSVFLFPYHRITFIEIPAPSVAGSDLPVEMPVPIGVGVSAAGPAADDEAELEIDEDFLRRVREA